MAGDRKVYEEALNEGSNYAWERRWEEAAEAYRRALAEFPDDLAALVGLGLALFESGRLEEALEAYQRAAEIDTENPTLPERVGQTLEKLGRLKEAAQAYLQAAERYTHRQAPSLALERWEDAIRVDPSCIPAHVHLLRAYLSQGKTANALREYLALAEIYSAQGKTDQALELCQYALRIDPHHPEVLAMMDRLRYGEEVPLDRPPGTGPLDLLPEEEEEEETRGNPAEIARERALSDLAEMVFDESLPQTGNLVLRPLTKVQVNTLIARALDAQTRDDLDEAIACYEEVLRGGIIQPAVNFNLGLLYQRQLRFEEAIEQFEQALQAPQYRLGSLFALGECCRALGRIEEALTYFLEVLKTVDLGTVEPDRAKELTRLYDGLSRLYTARGEEEWAVDFINALIDFLNAKDWEEKAIQARKRLDNVAQDGPILSLAELLMAPDPDRVLHSLGLAQEYAQQGLWNAALDELFLTLTVLPTCLLIHRQIGEILLQMGETDQALEKFQSIAGVHQVRGDLFQAAAMYERILQLAPMDVRVRSRLIDLLIGQGEITRALEQYLVLGETYYQMAQWDRARETYNEALQLALQKDVEREWAVRILHRIGDIDMQRVDWKRAIAVYEQIRDLDPNDEKARMTLIDLYYRFGKQAEALKELDALLRTYRETGETAKVIPTLRALVDEYPDDIPLLARLAQTHLDAGNVEEALEALDRLGDLQLQAGRIKEAINTIKVILRLNPPNADAYRELLEQLEAGQIP
ncbi:MAG TPA: tetratricopeptide repeat protein [Thermoflexia bacterium]|nr:tetratricopeptide repeat protein [Thermoflexia bacterium]